VSWFLKLPMLLLLLLGKSSLLVRVKHADLGGIFEGDSWDWKNILVFGMEADFGGDLEGENWSIKILEEGIRTGLENVKECYLIELGSKSLSYKSEDGYCWNYLFLFFDSWVWFDMFTNSYFLFYPCSKNYLLFGNCISCER